MEEINNVLNQHPTNNGAVFLMKKYNEITGEKIKVGCLCKSTNINKVYSQVQEWYTSLKNN